MSANKNTSSDRHEKYNTEQTIYTSTWPKFKESNLYGNLIQNGADPGILWSAFYQGAIMEREELIKMIRSTLVICSDEGACDYMQKWLDSLLEPPASPKALLVDVTDIEICEQ